MRANKGHVEAVKTLLAVRTHEGQDAVADIGDAINRMS